MLQFTNKAVIITGAARGMGKACAIAFANAGAQVALLDVDSDALDRNVSEIQERGGVARAFICDVTDAGAVRDVIHSVQESYGSVDVLVNNAGILRTTTPLEQISEAEWDQVLDVNLKGMFLVTRTVLPIMREQGSGKIINMSSSAGRSTSELGGAHYTVSKTAVLGLTRHLAREYGQYGINVYSVCPGLVDTPMVREQAKPEVLDHWQQQIPLGRLAEPEEAADLVLFLASDSAKYITGATIDFNGGSLLI